MLPGRGDIDRCVSRDFAASCPVSTSFLYIYIYIYIFSLSHSLSLSLSLPLSLYIYTFDVTSLQTERILKEVNACHHGVPSGTIQIR